MREAPIEGSAEFLKRLKRAENEIPGIVLMGWQAKAIAYAKQNIQPYSKTHYLQASIQPGEMDIKAGTATITAGGPGMSGYARFVEEGTGIYGPNRRPIVPVRAKFLRFPAKGADVRQTGSLTKAQQRAGGGWVFKKSVLGRKATPFLKPAVERAGNELGIAYAVDITWGGRR